MKDHVLVVIRVCMRSLYLIRVLLSAGWKRCDWDARQVATYHHIRSQVQCEATGAARAGRGGQIVGHG